MSLPPELRLAIERDLRPIRPLPRPWRRCLALTPLVVLLPALVHLVFDTRPDAPRLGPVLLWGFFISQLLLGVLLLAGALREAVPGESLRGRWLASALGLVVVWLGVATWITWRASPALVPADSERLYWGFCVSGQTLLGLPLVAIALHLIRRGFALRPALAGALGGLGTGLVVDAGWRTYCEVSSPHHVVGAHLLAILMLTLIGALGGVLWGRRRQSALSRC